MPSPQRHAAASPPASVSRSVAAAQVARSPCGHPQARHHSHRGGRRDRRLAVTCTALPEIIRTRGEARSRIIRETAEAQALIRTEARTALLQAGLDAATTTQAAEMLPTGHRHRPARRAPPQRRSPRQAPHRPPVQNLRQKPGGGPKKPDRGSKGNVVPIRPG